MGSNDRRLLPFLLLLLAGCAARLPDEAGASGTGGKADEGDEDGTSLRHWLLRGDGLTEERPLMVRAPATAAAELFVDGAWTASLDQSGDEGGAPAFQLWPSSLEPGAHTLEIRSGDVVISSHDFQVSYPLYLVVSADWDTADNTEQQMALQDQLYEAHPELRVTHFLGPYTFTDPAVSPERADWLVKWLQGHREADGDEIGLHIHPYCHFVEDAGVTCRTEPAYADSWRGDGYTVRSSAYSEEEYTTILEHAVALFVDHGLDAPTSFRAGGWSLELHTLRALESAGFVADTSANNWRPLEAEWAGYPGADLFEWNMEHWATIDETSQPYYPSTFDILADAAPHLGILEVPDNGILSDYVTTDQMIEMFHANFDGSALEAPRQYSIGYHPPSFDRYHARLEGALDYIDGYLAESDHGPVVYATLSELTRVWGQPEAL